MNFDYQTPRLERKKRSPLQIRSLVLSFLADIIELMETVDSSFSCHRVGRFATFSHDVRTAHSRHDPINLFYPFFKAIFFIEPCSLNYMKFEYSRFKMIWNEQFSLVRRNHSSARCCRRLGSLNRIHKGRR